VTTDDTFSKLLADARDELAERFSEGRRHPSVKRVADLIDELASNSPRSAVVARGDVTGLDPEPLQGRKFERPNKSDDVSNRRPAPSDRGSAHGWLIR
jgi:hypothetical protein